MTELSASALTYIYSYATAAIGLLSIVALVWWAGRPNRMRDQEQSDRDFFDRNGYWPDERGAWVAALSVPSLLATALDSLTNHVSGSPVTYLICFVAAAGDVLLPLIPSETILITAGVVASRGHLSVPLLIVCGGVGASCGDNLAYLLGDRVGEPIADRLFKGGKARDRLEWSERAIRSHGPVLVVVGRFIPGGRTASTLAAGLLQMPWKTRFLPFDIGASVVWSAYVVLLGYEGGSAFEDSTWKPLLLAFGVAVLVALGIEGYRRVQKRRGKDVLGDPLSDKS